MSEEKPIYGIRGGLAHDVGRDPLALDFGSGSFVAWDNTKCNPLAPAREQAKSAWEDGHASAKKEWVGLTDDERRNIPEWQEIQKELGPVWAPMMLYLYLVIEAKLKEKNT